MIVALYTLFELVAILICLFALYDRKFKLDVKTVGFVVIDVGCILIVYYMRLSFAHTLFFYPLLFCYCILEFGINIKRILINIVICLTLMFGFQIIGYIVFGICFPFVTNEGIAYIIINLITVTLAVIITRKVKLNKIPDFLHTKDLENIISVAICYTLIAMKYIQFKMSGKTNYAEYAIAIVVTGYILIITAIVRKYKIIAKEKEEEIYIREKYYASYGDMISDIKSRQHDFDNHINAIRYQHYLHENDKNKLDENQKKYLEEIASENEFNKVLISGNPILVSFLYSKFNEAKKKDIQIKYKLDFGELKSSVPITKLVELMGNLLDNAIDATVERDYRIINVCVQENVEDINISISNTSKVIPLSVVSELFRKGKSTKGGDRGYGLYNVKRICDEYDVAISYYNDFIDEQNYMVFELKIHKNCGS